MKNFKMASGLLALPLLLAATGESSAWSRTFAGTQGEVRLACVEVGGYLLDAPNHTSCFNDLNGTSVTCNDAGHCSNSGPGLSPTRIGANMGLGSEPLSVGSLAQPGEPAAPLVE